MFSAHYTPQSLLIPMPDNRNQHQGKCGDGLSPIHFAPTDHRYFIPSAPQWSASLTAQPPFSRCQLSIPARGLLSTSLFPDLVACVIIACRQTPVQTRKVQGGSDQPRPSTIIIVAPQHRHRTYQRRANNTFTKQIDWMLWACTTTPRMQSQQNKNEMRASE